ncbi:iron-containing alcohol dehydrogenase [Colwellia sp. 1_MG-2023]|uniref:iron-containing alcohol dehydrogenase n=1 Tax=Colwellia sp. 1_MG-2023 TaxID=3062649 RepID=UPI0026E2D21C|nr:iron-containing alcohol dehydrogenase [Colwellia sp. 1_MG-2023]MDO6446602.1 iron-containing alcohol dehydrogenase [Colwellia sp. 1_MG-2023]
MIHSFIIFIRRYVNRLIHIPMPTLINGSGELRQSAEILKDANSRNTFIVTDKTLVGVGVVKKLTDFLEKAQLPYVIFDEVTPDPTIAVIEQGVHLYQQNNCDSMIVIGGGSVMDCGKAIAASVVKNKNIQTLSGLFKVRKKLPPFIAIPTTAGTGSEATLVAVVTDPSKKQKFTVIDPCLVPHYAILDPLLMVGLPAKITAETGIDALTHAVESYIGLHGTAQTQSYSLAAIQRIFTYLPQAYQQGDNLTARAEMSLASYYAGVAFTRTSIGYVHAIAHQLGGYYHIPHGLANAVLLPHVLHFSFDNAFQQYAKIAYHLGIVEQHENEIVAAKAFVQAVISLNTTLNIQKTFPELKKQDISLLAKRAMKEAYCEYPVPKQMTTAECEQILLKLLKE